MNRFQPFSCLLPLFLVSIAFAQDSTIRYEFSKASAAENGITIQGPGFGQMPLAQVRFEAIPTDRGFSGATDGIGMKIQARPGQGVMLLTGPLAIPGCALVRCSVRASTPHVSVYLATLDQGENQFITTVTPTNGAYFAGRYNRIASTFLTPSTGFQALVQVVNTSPTETLVAYVDNLEVRPAREDKLEFDVADLVGIPLRAIALTVPLPNLPAGAQPLQMVYLKAGTFLMGSPPEESGRAAHEGPQHPVTLTEGFYLSKYEVTQAQWQAVMGHNPAHTFGVGANYPVYYVSWNDCQAFLQKLNQLGPGTFRLPTEAEWEYAGRAGTSTRFSWGDDADSSQIGHYAWYRGNSGFQAHEVGLQRPNPWGLFDLSGNVYEWCQDRYGAYSRAAQTDPVGPASGTTRVIRGGGVNDFAGDCRSAVRIIGDPDTGYGGSGLRLARTP